MRVLGDVQFDDVLASYRQENVGSKALEHGAGELMKANKNGLGRWTLAVLSRPDVLGIMLPCHRRCGVELIPESGMTVSAAAARVKDVTRETGECWENIASHKERDFSQTHIFLEVENKGLKHLDGLHRLLAWVLFERQEEPHAYVVRYWGSRSARQ